MSSVLKSIFTNGNCIVIELADESGYVNRSEIDLTSTTFSAKEIAEMFCLKGEGRTSNIFMLRGGAKLMVLKSDTTVDVTIKDPIFGEYFYNYYDISEQTSEVYDCYMLQ